jgi:hypothetical protein
MTRSIRLVLTLLLFPCLAHSRKIPVSVSRTGQDYVGSLFTAALQKELSQSVAYAPVQTAGTDSGLRFYVELSTIEVADKKQDQGKRSVVSIVIQDMGSPNSYPVANMWYHKVIVVDTTTVGEIAKELLEDMDARWCQYNKNSVGGCPKEKLYPQALNARD